MQDISSGQGRTVLFVSHNMTSVKDLCTRVLVLENGTVKNIGMTNEMINEYLDNTESTISGSNSLIDDTTRRRGNGELRFKEITIQNDEKFIDPLKSVLLKCKIEVIEPIQEAFFSLYVRNNAALDKFKSSSFITSSKQFPLDVKDLNKGAVIDLEFEIPANTFRTGNFPLYLFLGRNKAEGTAGDNYPYDVVDSVYNLNYRSVDSEYKLGYNPLQPNGFFNLDLRKIRE